MLGGRAAVDLLARRARRLVLEPIEAPEEAAAYERATKTKPPAFVVQLRTLGPPPAARGAPLALPLRGELRVGVQVRAHVHRATAAPPDAPATAAELAAPTVRARAASRRGWDRAIRRLSSPPADRAPADAARRTPTRRR